MRISSVLLVFFGLMSACAPPKQAETGPSRREAEEINVVRAYFAAIAGRNQGALSSLLAENVKVMVGPKNWGKADELTHRVEAWTRDPKYTAEITSITVQGGLVRARVMVTYESQGARARQEIENTFIVQHHQIVQAILSP